LIPQKRDILVLPLDDDEDEDVDDMTTEEATCFFAFINASLMSLSILILENPSSSIPCEDKIYVLLTI
jgi:hypothetical protein